MSEIQESEVLKLIGSWKYLPGSPSKLECFIIDVKRYQDLIYFRSKPHFGTELDLLKQRILYYLI